MMYELIDRAIHNSRVVLLMLFFIFFTGLIAYQNMPKEAEPDIAIPIIYVSMFHEGISPEDAERLLVRPMEKELRTIENVKEMTAIAGEGHASVILEFHAGFDNDQALQDVLQKVNVAKAKLPQETEEPSVNEVNFSLFPILVVTLAGDVPERTLLTLARRLKDAIESIPEVLKVEIAGNREEVIEITIDPLRIESYGLNYQEVVQFFMRNNQLVAAGALDTGQGRFNVKVPGVFETLEDMLKLPIKVNEDRVVTLQDVTHIRRTFKDPTSYARINGKPALALEISKRSGTNIISTIDQVKAILELAHTTQKWPENIHVNFIQDRSKDIKTMFNELQNSVLMAVILVTIVIVAALGLHSALLVALSIPGSFLLGILMLAQSGITMNIVVLFSLILASGMLVDGAIIVTEFADRKMLEGMSRLEAYSLASKRMFWPVLGSILTMISVFLPLLFWPGLVGEFMKYLPITVIATLAASLLMAFIFTPTLGSLFGRPSPIHLSDHESLPLHHITGLTGLYVRLLDRILHIPWIILLMAVALLVIVFIIYGRYGKGVEFFPDVEPEQINVYVRTRGDFSIYERDQLVRQVEHRLLGMPEFENVYANTGIVNARNAPEDTIGVISIEFINWQRRRPAKEIINEIRERTKDLAGMIVEVLKLEGGPGEGKPIKLEVSARDPTLLGPAVEQIVKGLQKIPGLVDIEDDRPLPGIDWKMDVDREQASRFGADIATVGSAVQLVTNGIKVGEYRPDDADEELDIRVRFPLENRGIEQLDRLKIQTYEGLVPISLFVKRIAQPRVGTLKRSEERRALTVQAGVAEGILVDDKLKEIRTWFSTTSLDPQVTVTFKGEERDQREAQEFLSQAFINAIFIMAMVMVAQFNSFYQTFVILSAVILSTMGVLFGLLVTQQPFGIVMNGLGVISLAGIIVNNNIVLVDTFNIFREAGMDIREAILRTCAQRLRPVLLTKITAILGLLPMVLAMNIDLLTREVTFGAPSTQWWTQLSTSVVGGLTFATALTLGVTPCLLMIRYGRSKTR